MNSRWCIVDVIFSRVFSCYCGYSNLRIQLVRKAQYSDHCDRSIFQSHDCDWLPPESNRCSRKDGIYLLHVHIPLVYFLRYGLFNFAAGLPVIVVTVIPKQYFLVYFFVVEYILLEIIRTSLIHCEPSSSSYTSVAWSYGEKLWWSIVSEKLSLLCLSWHCSHSPLDVVVSSIFLF